MTTRQLHQAVSRVTGEDVDLIVQRGFNLVDQDEPPVSADDWENLALDWDELDAVRTEEIPCEVT